MYMFTMCNIVNYHPSLEGGLAEIEILMTDSNKLPVEIIHIEVDGHQLVEKKICDVLKTKRGLRIEFLNRTFPVDIMDLPLHYEAVWKNT